MYKQKKYDLWYKGQIEDWRGNEEGREKGERKKGEGEGDLEEIEEERELG